ncbi:EthD domain-containing protein [Arthrobacter ginkgonis]|uniref:EthD domain-containing protein n=1 Tax=Arthrobacter ginkgonis TaxID=1630594 RepID=UPI0031F09E87
MREADLQALADELTASGLAEQCAVDLVVPGSFEAGPATASVDEITALFHAYGVPQNLSREGTWTGLLQGMDTYSVAERTVFDRSRPSKPGQPAAGPLRLGTQRRLAALSGEQFRNHWWNSHAPKVTRHMPGVVRYTQSYVLSCSPGAVEMDGWYESLLRSPQSLTTDLFDSDEGKRIMDLDGEAMVDSARTERASMRRLQFFPEPAYLERSLRERSR